MRQLIPPLLTTTAPPVPSAMQRVPLRTLDECSAEKILATGMLAAGEDFRTATLYANAAGALFVLEESFVRRTPTLLQRLFGWPVPKLDPRGSQLFRVTVEEALLLAVEAITPSTRFNFMARERLAANGSINGGGRR